MHIIKYEISISKQQDQSFTALRKDKYGNLYEEDEYFFPFYICNIDGFYRWVPIDVNKYFQLGPKLRVEYSEACGKMEVYSILNVLEPLPDDIEDYIHQEALSFGKFLDDNQPREEDLEGFLNSQAEMFRDLELVETDNLDQLNLHEFTDEEYEEAKRYYEENENYLCMYDQDEITDEAIDFLQKYLEEQYEEYLKN